MAGWLEAGREAPIPYGGGGGALNDERRNIDGKTDNKDDKIDDIDDKIDDIDDIDDKIDDIDNKISDGKIDGIMTERHRWQDRRHI